MTIRSRTALEVALAGGAACIALVFSGPASAGRPWVAAWAAPSVFLYAPLAAVFFTDRDLEAIGLSLPGFHITCLDLACFSLVILPLFLVGWSLFALHWLGADFRPGPVGDLAGLAVWQALGVALPEELFFRGWLQGRLKVFFNDRFRLLGARFGPSLFIAAAAFAGAHLIVTPSPERLLVFFPGLLFGFYRERSGSIVAPAAAHAVANVAFLTVQSWAFHHPGM